MRPVSDFCQDVAFQCCSCSSSGTGTESYLVKLTICANCRVCDCRPLPGPKVLSKSTSAASEQESDQEQTPAAHLPNILDQGEDVIPAHPVQSPFEAAPSSPSAHPAPKHSNADLPTRHQSPGGRATQPAERKLAGSPSGSLLSPSRPDPSPSGQESSVQSPFGQDSSLASQLGRDFSVVSPLGQGSSLVSPSGQDSSCTFTSHSGSNSGRVRTHTHTSITLIARVLAPSLLS